MHEVLPGVFHWTTFHPGIQTEVCSYWLDESGVLVDPLLAPDAELDWFAGRATQPQVIVLCNRHHYRDSGRFVERFGIPVYANRAGLHEFTHGEQVAPFDPGDTFPGGLVVHEVGGICPDDSALYLPASRTIVFADGVVRGGVEGHLGRIGFVPDQYMDDPPETKRQLLAALSRLLGELDFEHVLLTHGGPLVGDGRAELEELVSSGGRSAFELE